MLRTFETHVICSEQQPTNQQLPADVLLRKSITLVQEPANENDLTPLAFMINGYCAGYVRLEDSCVISAALDLVPDNVKVEVTSSEELFGTAGRFHIQITVEFLAPDPDIRAALERLQPVKRLRPILRSSPEAKAPTREHLTSAQISTDFFWLHDVFAPHDDEVGNQQGLPLMGSILPHHRWLTPPTLSLAADSNCLTVDEAPIFSASEKKIGKACGQPSSRTTFKSSGVSAQSLKRSIKTHVVGLQFQRNQAWLAATLNDKRPLILVREPTNTNDPNAVAVMINGRKVGYIRRKHAEIIAPAMDSGQSSLSVIVQNPAEINIQTNSFAITIVFQTNAPALALPSLSGSKIGIYRIRLLPDGNATYIGQSRNIGARLAQHWADMRLGFHANRHLQTHWNRHGSNGFQAEVVVGAPNGLSAYEQQQWLHIQERSWIERDLMSGHCVNLAESQLVLTPEAASERAEMIRRHDEALTVQRNYISSELARLKTEGRPNLERVEYLEESIRELEKYLTRRTGIRAFFRGDRISREEQERANDSLATAKTKLVGAKKALEPFQTGAADLQKQLKGLKTYIEKEKDEMARARRFSNRRYHDYFNGPLS